MGGKSFLYEHLQQERSEILQTSLQELVCIRPIHSILATMAQDVAALVGRSICIAIEESLFDIGKVDGVFAAEEVVGLVGLVELSETIFESLGIRFVPDFVK